MIIRQMSDADRNSVEHLLVDVFTGEQCIPARMIPLPPEMKPQWWCAAESDGRVVGAIAAWLDKEKIHLGRFAVQSDYRGQHIGSRLIRVAVRDLFEQGVKEIYAEARPAAVQILYGMGAEICGPDHVFFEGTVTPVILRREDR